MKSYQVFLALGFAALAVLALVPGAEAAPAQDCETACTSTSACSTACSDGGLPTTCGLYRVCQPSCGCDNRIDGTEFGDTLLGTGVRDCVYGHQGDDTIYGNSGADILKGQAGDDTLYGGPGEDCLYGGGGNDHLDGGADTDYCTTGEWYVSCEIF